jgi:isopenicillin N synthase-like dioxygenase
MLEVPVIDISPSTSEDGARRVAAEIGRACESVGFLVIEGHGIPEGATATMRGVCRAFFDQSLEEKLRWRVAPGGGYVGYSPLEAESLSNTIGQGPGADLKESFTCSPVHATDDPYYVSAEGQGFFELTPWPASPTGFRSAWEEYYRRMSDVAARLMGLFALALDLDRDHFASSIDRHITAMRVINYPRLGHAPPAGQFRAGPHTDYGSLTIVSTDDAPGGLEIQTADGSWHPVPVVPGALIVNLGDLMAQWTNDRWVSTMHRVVPPPVGTGDEAERLSIVFFHQPNHDAVIEPIATCIAHGEAARYAPTTSGQHLIDKVTMQQLVAGA